MSCACAIEIEHEEESEMIFEKDLMVCKNQQRCCEYECRTESRSKIMFW